MPAETKEDNYLIHHHLGLGDHIVCNAIVRKAYYQNSPLSLIVAKRVYPSVKDLYKDIDIKLIQVTDDSEGYSLYKNYKVLRIGFEKAQLPEWEKSFYNQVGMDYSKRFSEFFIERDYEREQLLEQQLNLPKKFAFCNKSCSKGEAPVTFNTKLPIISLSPISKSMFDWIGVLEKATEIHTIDSSLFQLVNQFNLPGKKYFYDIQGSAISRTPYNIPEHQEWNIINEDY